MQESRFNPRIVLILGGVLLLFGAILQIVLPNIGYSVVNSSADAAAGVDQGILLLFDTVTRVVSVLVTPMGTALFGAGIVMSYLQLKAAEKSSV